MTHILTNNGKDTTLYTYNEYLMKSIKENNFPYLILGKLNGCTYQEKKADLTEKAKIFSIIDIGGLSWFELSIISNYFYTYGKKYGLIKEFKENGIL